jgi:UDP-2,3-diacylglucosamine pyrophosphatase LpxH
MWLRRQIFKLVLWASNKFSSRPEKGRVFDALDTILRGIRNGKESKGLVIPFDATTGRIIIFSDQHKGTRNGADDFMLCEPAYLAALDHYYQQNFYLIILGDCEELWENPLSHVLRQQTESFTRYKKFAANNTFCKIIGNHDLDWKNDPLVMAQIKSIFDADISVYDGVLLQTAVDGTGLEILCTHGHQGDKASDGNWFSKFFVAKIWAPLQAWLKDKP